MTTKKEVPPTNPPSPEGQKTGSEAYQDLYTAFEENGLLEPIDLEAVRHQLKKVEGELKKIRKLLKKQAKAEKQQKKNQTTPPGILKG